MKKWYTKSSTNYGVMIKAVDENTSAGRNIIFNSELYDDPQTRPCMLIKYIDSTGIELQFSYHNQFVDNTTGYVNDFSGNLTLVENALTMGGSRMPVNVQLLYNSNKYNYATQGGIPIGAGFTTNFNMTVKKTTGSNGFAPEIYKYIFTDSDGTQHYYKVSNSNGTECYDEFQPDNKLIVANNTITINNKKADIKYEFRTSDGKPTQIIDNNNNAIKINYDSAGKVNYIEDGTTVKDSNRITTRNGRRTNFSYNSNGYLSRIQNTKEYIDLIRSV